MHRLQSFGKPNFASEFIKLIPQLQRKVIARKISARPLCWTIHLFHIAVKVHAIIQKNIASQFSLLCLLSNMPTAATQLFSRPVQHSQLPISTVYLPQIWTFSSTAQFSWQRCFTIGAGGCGKLCWPLWNCWLSLEPFLSRASEKALFRPLNFQFFAKRLDEK